MLNKIKPFLKREKGAETLEYAVIAGVIILLGIIAYNTGAIGTIIQTMFDAITAAVAGIG